jgi:hypothetical protein
LCHGDVRIQKSARVFVQKNGDFQKREQCDILTLLDAVQIGFVQAYILAELIQRKTRLLAAVPDVVTHRFEERFFGLLVGRHARKIAGFAFFKVV